MHACIERLTKPGECLEAAADGGVFLQHRYVQPLFCQNGATEQSTQSSTYYYNTIHFSLFSVIS